MTRISIFIKGDRWTASHGCLMIIKKKWMYVGIVMVIAILLAIIEMGGNKVTAANVMDVNMAEHKDLALHIHSHVKITIKGEAYPIPAGIGISENGMRVIHTHEPDGNLHIEAPIPHQFYLGDFFSIWGKRLTNECVFEFCSNDKDALKFYVNGEESSLGPDIPLQDLNRIEIVYGGTP